MVETDVAFEFKKKLRRLREFRGNGTELISVYIPAGSPLHDTTNKLREEMSQASNIKSKSTRTNVVGALERIIGYLKIYKCTPENGIAVFCGNISDNSAKVVMELFAVDPIQKLNIGTYRCDSKFFLEPLDRMVASKDSYGIIAMDGREATLAIVIGTEIRIVKKLNSNAHQKINKGGQCLAPETLVQKSDGDICEVRELLAQDHIKAIDLNDHKTKDFVCSDVFRTKSRSYHVIKTHAPATEIKATPYHRFLVVSEHGIKERYAKDMCEGDKLLAVRKINHTGNLIKIDRDKVKLTSKTIQAKKYAIPDYVNENVAYFLGVVCGDGTLDGNRLIVYEGKEEMVKHYADAFKRTFGIDAVIRKVDKTKQKGSFAKKPYFELRLYSLQIAELVRLLYGSVLDRAEKRSIPKEVLGSNENVCAAFLSGLFDAEGYIDSGIVSIAGRSKKLMQQCQMLLLRFGIISAFKEKTVVGNPQWHITITDAVSLKCFQKCIGFTRKDKSAKLTIICSKMNHSQQYSDQIPVHGRLVYNLIKSIGLRSRDFRCGDYFTDKKSMGRSAFFKSILVRLGQNKTDSRVKKIHDLLNVIYKGNAIITKVSKNTKFEEAGEFYDLTIPSAANFVANGLIVHNSQRRFQRLIEESIEKYYVRVGEAMDEHFLGRIKGVVVGGPGPTKDAFLKMKPFNYQIKVLGMVDSGYTDEYGIREVLAKCESLISEQEAVKEKLLIDRFMKEVVTEGLATYGKNEVETVINSKQADVVLLSEGLDPNLLESLADAAKEKGIKIEIVSTDTAEGAQFLNGFGGIGAFLRYRSR